MPARMVDKACLADWVKKSLPEDDRIDIFGLSKSSEMKAAERRAFNLMSRVYRH